MATSPKSEYVGFTVNKTSRVYRLRVRKEDVLHEFTLAIPNQAFTGNRVRYQDAPEICFLRLERELLANADSLPPSHLQISDAELDEYREAHKKKPLGRRSKLPAKS
jgi:hypothetical protein